MDGAPPFAELLSRARGSQRLWAAARQQDRDDRYSRLSDIVLSAAEDIDHVAQLVHKPVAEALSAELLPLLECIRYVQKHAPDILADQTIPVAVAPHKRNVIVRRPHGVVLVIAPFNFPLSIAGSEILFAVAAENAVVLKPSPHRVQAAHFLAEAFVKAGFPPHLVQVEPGDPAHTQALIEGGVDYVTFVGSTEAGREVAKACIDAGVPCRAELGGKAAAVVLDDAPLSRTARAILWGTFMGAGQVCAGVQRVFVQRALMNPLCDKLREVAVEIDAERDLAPLVSAEARARVDALVDEALGRGGRVVVEKNTAQCRAVVLRCDDDGARLFGEECFGPVSALCPVDDVEQAVAKANAGPGDLMGYVFGKAARAKHVRGQLEASTVMINDVLWSYGMPETPWGGAPKSSMGVTHGADGLLGYTRALHTVHEQVPVRLDKEPFWYPYTDERVRALRAGMRTLYGRGADKVKSIAAYLLRRDK